jgi:fucose 4-O-acetylase-like acetyltransferase
MKILDKRGNFVYTKTANSQQPTANSQQPTANSQPYRSLWVDFAKVIGIWLVILGHMHIPGDFIKIIYSFHMPLFFFISGYLEKDKDIKSVIKQGVKTLILPYCILYAIDYLWWVPADLLQHPEIFGKISLKNMIIKPFLGMLFGIGFNPNISIMINGPLWFLIGLFCVKVIQSIIIKICKNTWYYLLCTYMIISLVYAIIASGIDLYFSMDSAMLAFPFFAIGNIIKRQGIFKSFAAANATKKHRPVFFLLGIFSFAMLIIAVPINGNVDVSHSFFGKNIAIFYCIAFIGIIAVLFFSLLYTRESKIINILSKGTILIMAFHGKFIGLFRIISIRLMGEDIIISPLIGMIVSTITLLLFIIPIMFIQKYMPIVIGGRK